MKLTSLDLSGDWQLKKPLTLGAQTLLVGINASGKSTLISTIELLARLISGDLKPADTGPNRNIGLVAQFENAGSTLTYELTIKNARVTHERFLDAGNVLMSRADQGAGRIRYQETQQMMDFQSPETALAVVTRQDQKQHPFLEPLAKWGRTLYCAYFGSHVTMAKRMLMAVGPTPASTSLEDPALRPNTHILLLLQRGLLSTSREAFKQNIAEDMGRLNYAIEDIDFRIAPELSPQVLGARSVIATFGPSPTFQMAATPVVAFIREKGVANTIDQFEISEGMWRALTIITYLNFIKISSGPSCIIIDDIGEGLDFDRSCKLINLIQERAGATGVQLIMSTNDRFVMNSVPLENWTVLRRVGSVIDPKNYENSRTIFDDFKDTGLNNFDFLRMDFLDRANGQEPPK